MSKTNNYVSSSVACRIKWRLKSQSVDDRTDYEIEGEAAPDKREGKRAGQWNKKVCDRTAWLNTNLDC